MPISFLNPALLVGALAAAVPVIIHFLSRRRVQRARFSDLRFLAEVQSRQARSLGLRRWLLLLLRVLAILCVVLAAAGPRWGGLGGGAGARAVLFVIDNSASMQTGQAEGTRLEAAVRACGEMIGALPADTSVQVLVGGSRVSPLFGDWLPAGAGAAAGLELVTATDGAFDLAAVLTEAGRLVARAPASPVQIILLSDLQAVPADPAWAVGASRLRASGPSDLLVQRVGETADGGGVLSVRLPARAVQPGENITIGARVIPQFGEQVFTLDLDGKTVAEVVTDSPAGAPVDLDFFLPAPSVGRHLGLVRKESDSLPRDDSRPFVLTVPQHLQILLVHGADQPRDGAAGRGGWRYLVEALGPGRGESVFRTRAVSSDELTTGDIGAADIVFLVDCDPLGRRALDGLLAWVRVGGQAVILAGDPKLAAYLSDTLLPALGLPGEVGLAVAGEPGQRTRIVAVDHPLLAGLDPPALETLQEVQWHRWLRLREGSGRVLLALTGEDPLLIETGLGRGRVVVMPVNLHPSGGDLAGSPMALPLFQRLAGWLAGGRSSKANLEAGQEAIFSPAGEDARTALAKAAELKVLGVAGVVSGAAELFWDGAEPRIRAGLLDLAGFVTLVAASDTLGQLAVAVPASESSLPLHTPAAFGRVLAGLELAPAADLTGREASGLVTALGGRDLTVWLLAVALALLAIESWVGRGTQA
jgi:hypothetical protein